MPTVLKIPYDAERRNFVIETPPMVAGISQLGLVGFLRRVQVAMFEVADVGDVECEESAILIEFDQDSKVFSWSKHPSIGEQDASGAIELVIHLIVNGFMAMMVEGMQSNLIGPNGQPIRRAR